MVLGNVAHSIIEAPPNHLILKYIFISSVQNTGADSVKILRS